ncbi:von willebrand factor type A domain protein (macronuclear) [Tetrahymena thermophila SB210]|uniref:von willebrand factor type A domain protein n=1 Tax=Tetrahymena thermophila (strain SB210) TaxID=312017 RepID=Q22EZ9_TETTS|nr:von willebrand factor type A domain protein [Tetrahymena thermophila SB210]EAR83876.3 von willebrand factor type A domain protein [Tetrahymena thermophila SB210]|eukprot:XP_001031539.3 von willebrand factor type A domain protein [Tetrahymena thermophila SB210]
MTDQMQNKWMKLTYFVDALAGHFSVISKDLVLDIEIPIRDQNFTKLLSKCTVSKTYGDMWITLAKNIQIKFNSLRCGTIRDIVFEINDPKKKVDSIQDIEKVVDIFKMPKISFENIVPTTSLNSKLSTKN